nr:MgtC/SapB family protein [Pseudomonas sp.]
LRLMMAMLLGGLLGYERESRGAAAGLRTHMLVSLGSALFVLAPLQGGMEIGDLSRVMQGVVAGIGFLGAGTIIKLRSDGEIHGLTTAASIWVASAVGIAAGTGRESMAVLATIFSLFTLAVLKRFTRKGSDEDEPPETLEATRQPARADRHDDPDD